MLNPVLWLITLVERTALEWRDVEGLQVCYGGDDQEFAQVGAGIRLLKSVDPRRFRRALRYTPRVQVTFIEPGRYDPYLRACIIGPEACKRPDGVAGTRVHESTHGLLLGRGFQYRHAHRPRHEALCLAEEVRFRRRLVLSSNAPEHAKQEYLVALEAWATAALKSQWWTKRLSARDALRAFRASVRGLK